MSSCFGSQLLAGLLAVFCVLPRARANRMMEVSIGIAVVTLLLFAALLRQRSSSHRVLRIEPSFRRVHYVQLIMHACVYTYWGWYWRVGLLNVECEHGRSSACFKMREVAKSWTSHTERGRRRPGADSAGRMIWVNRRLSGIWRLRKIWRRPDVGSVVQSRGSE